MFISGNSNKEINFLSNSVYNYVAPPPHPHLTPPQKNTHKKNTPKNKTKQTTKQKATKHANKDENPQYNSFLKVILKFKVETDLILVIFAYLRVDVGVSVIVSAKEVVNELTKPSLYITFSGDNEWF